MKYREEPADIAVKERLWAATERELMHFATRYREEHSPGVRSSAKQEQVVAAAAQRGYPIKLLRFLGAQKRSEVMDDAAHAQIHAFRARIGLECGSTGARR